MNTKKTKSEIKDREKIVEKRRINEAVVLKYTETLQQVSKESMKIPFLEYGLHVNQFYLDTPPKKEKRNVRLILAFAFVSLYHVFANVMSSDTEFFNETRNLDNNFLKYIRNILNKSYVDLMKFISIELNF